MPGGAPVNAYVQNANYHWCLFVKVKLTVWCLEQHTKCVFTVYLWIVGGITVCARKYEIIMMQTRIRHGFRERVAFQKGKRVFAFASWIGLLTRCMNWKLISRIGRISQFMSFVFRLSTYTHMDGTQFSHFTTSTGAIFTLWRLVLVHTL